MHTTSKLSYNSQFPFFKEVSSYITNMIEQNVAEVNENVDILQDNTASEFTAGMIFEDFVQTTPSYMYIC